MNSDQKHSIIADDLQLVIQKAYDIVNGLHNDEHEWMLIKGYIRQNIETCRNNIFIPNDIVQTCQLFWGSLRLIITEQIHKIMPFLQDKFIVKRTMVIEAKLAEGKPLLEQAQKAVSSINKKAINEIKALYIMNPRKIVKMTFEAVALVMNQTVRHWRDMQKMMHLKSFIPSILKFDSNQYKFRSRQMMLFKLQKRCFSDDEFTYERAYKESKAVGVLFLWVKAQYKFAYLLQSVSPMADEVQELKREFVKQQKEDIDLESMVEQLAYLTE